MSFSLLSEKTHKILVKNRCHKFSYLKEFRAALKKIYPITGKDDKKKKSHPALSTCAEANAVFAELKTNAHWLQLAEEYSTFIATEAKHGPDVQKICDEVKESLTTVREAASEYLATNEGPEKWEQAANHGKLLLQRYSADAPWWRANLREGAT